MTITRSMTMLLLLPAVWAGGCAPPPRPPAPPPATAAVERRAIVETCSEEGILEAHLVYSFFPRVGDSPLAALHVKEGERVLRGDPLFTFDTETIDARRALVDARIQAAETERALLRERRGGAEAAQARQRLVRSEQELREARRNHAVQAELAEKGLAPETGRQDAEAALRAAELGLELARNELAELEAHDVTPEIAALEATLLEHRNTRARLAEEREEYAGAAPFDGRILRINDAVKNLSSVADELELQYRPGYGPLLILADTGTMRVMSRFFERDVARIREGQKAVVTSMHVPGETFDGAVVRVGELGETLGRTTTVSVEVLVDNRNDLLKPGLKAQTTVITAEAADVPAVPVEFVRTGEEGPYVLKQTGHGKPRPVPIETGVSDHRFVEVRAGLEEGDVVVME